MCDINLKVVALRKSLVLYIPSCQLILKSKGFDNMSMFDLLDENFKCLSWTARAWAGVRMALSKTLNLHLPSCLIIIQMGFMKES